MDTYANGLGFNNLEQNSGWLRALMAAGPTRTYVF